ncbi:MAG: 1,4-dihydroxy-2-naphthoate polyprenyltransferase [Streptosporangiales bacterium]|nr:1,4-dihydroxy-2-naphthoate polyprenyltransferase [Streptosporangiales bacterium]
MSPWVQGARPRTLTAAVTPVMAGAAVAVAEGGAVWWRAGLALAVALALQVGVNYANDYSDGIRGTDAARVGPTRLVASGLAAPRTVLGAALACFGLAGAAGLALAAATTWWLLAVGTAAIAAAWFYTGGSRPYGYRALGEVSVFAFFGLVAVVGTAYVQVERLTPLAFAVAVPVGLLICALLVINNLRDIPGDALAGKRTLAVVLGGPRTRVLYAGCVVVPFLGVLFLAVARPMVLVALPAAVLAVPPLRLALGGATGRDLVPALRDTGRLLLGYGILLSVGLLIPSGG